MMGFINHSERLEAVIICTGRSAVLDQTLEKNKRFLDGAMVVTLPGDTKTREIAKKHGTGLFITETFFHDGNVLDSGLPYSRAVAHLQFKEWVMFMCPDIVLHNNFRTELESFEMDRDSFYGCDRIDVDEIGETGFDGYKPCTTAEWGFGYLQMFHMSSCFLRGKPQIYPSSKTPWLSDYYFRAQFGNGHVIQANGIWNWNPKYQRKLQTPCYHLKHGPLDTWKEFAPEWAKNAF